MSKMTLLEIVQDTLSDMVSDEVNSIDDTVEAQSVAAIAKSVYHSMLANRNWPHTRRLSQLEAIADIYRPNYMRLPPNIKEIVSIQYDVSGPTDVDPHYRTIRYITPDEFLRLVSSRKTSSSNVLVVGDDSGVPLNIFNDKAPEVYTSFDDVHVVFDAYDSAMGTTLKASSSSCVAFISPEWDRSNEAVPDLPVDAFPGYLAEVKSAAFYNIKQMTNQKAELTARSQRTWLSRKAWRVNGDILYSDYGRKGRR